MDAHLAALFIHDENGRLVQPRMGRVADDSYPAPRFFIGRTAAGNSWRYRDDVEEELIGELEPLAAAVPPFAGPGTDLPEIAAIRDRLSARSPIESFWSGPAFRFPAKIDARDDADRPVVIDAKNARLLHPHFADSVAQLAATAPLIAAVRDGGAICTCESVRVYEGFHEAGLETVEAYRGHGFGPQITAAWARAIRASGDEPLYSTNWGNAPSRRVAEKLGLICYGEDLHFS